jgi:hypothetical protein
MIIAAAKSPEAYTDYNTDWATGVGSPAETKTFLFQISTGT